MKVFQIRLTQPSGAYIILEHKREDKGGQEYCEWMMNWYSAHKAFFNGELSIVEVDV